MFDFKAWSFETLTHSSKKHIFLIINNMRHGTWKTVKWVCKTIWHASMFYPSLFFLYVFSDEWLWKCKSTQQFWKSVQIELSMWKVWFETSMRVARNFCCFLFSVLFFPSFSVALSLSLFTIQFLISRSAIHKFDIIRIEMLKCEERRLKEKKHNFKILFTRCLCPAISPR